MATTFREAKIADLKYIVNVYNESIPGRMATADLKPITVADRKEWFYQHNPTTRPLLIILNDKQPVGWVSLNSFYGRQAYHNTVEISIYLDNKFQGKKLGSKTLDFVEENASRYGFKTILAFVFGHNTPSIKLFENHGYSGWADLPKVAELDGVQRDLVILGKRVRN